jgi:hypothetical protein
MMKKTNNQTCSIETRMNKSSTNNMKDNIMRVPDDHRNKNLSEETMKQQLADSSKTLAELTASMVYDNISLLKPLLKISFLEDNSLSQRASRVFTICCCRFPELIKPYLTDILNRLPDIRSEGSRRNLLKLFAEAPVSLSRRQQSILMNLCFDYLVGNYTVAVKVYSMEILYKLSTVYPEISQELYCLIEEQLPESSAGFKSRGSKILKKLSGQR